MWWSVELAKAIWTAAQDTLNLAVVLRFTEQRQAGMVTGAYWFTLVLDSNIQCLLFSNLNKTLNKLSNTVHYAKPIWANLFLLLYLKSWRDSYPKPGSHC